jgi:rhodanese-related sulfurtransferase/rubrerythrin
MSAPEARSFMEKLAADDIQLVDVRQPGEYRRGHLPGARLMPMADLGAASEGLDPDKPTLVYCAIGGRSRIAAQMLAGKGFSQVINLSGGIKAWSDNVAVGPEDAGLELFSGAETLPEVLTIAYGLESALQNFYRSMAATMKRQDVRDLFLLLASIEARHRQQIAERYRQLQAEGEELSPLGEHAAGEALEGGLTTEQYLDLYQPDLEKAEEVVALAMAIEAQALDLYQRAADRTASPAVSEGLMTIAGEEREHIRRLGALLDAETDPGSVR